MQMLNSPETYESSCNIALAYGDIEKNSGSEYIATLVSKLVWKRKVLDKNDNCGGYADEILATSAAVPLKVDNMALGEIPVVGTYKFNNCKIALKARDLFRNNMKPLFDGDKGQYEVGVSNAHARVIYVTDDNSVEASLSALRAQGKAAQSRVDMGDRSTGTYNFDSQNLRHAAGAYLGNAANWKIITDSNASLCQRGAHLSEYN